MEGKSQLHEFGVPPGHTDSEDVKVDDPGTNSEGKGAARAAMNDVADGHKPGDSEAVPKGTGDLGSGNAPLGILS